MDVKRKIGLSEDLNFSSLNEQQTVGYSYERSFQLGTFKATKTRSSTAQKSSEYTDLFLPFYNDLTPKISSSKYKNKPFYVFWSASKDWITLALLGIIMAVFSALMDVTIDILQIYHTQLYDSVKLSQHTVVTYCVWVVYVVLLITLSSLCCHYIAPQAIGSGIPEMKTILRGVVLKEYLSFRTLISKMSSLTLSLGSGLPMGKEGPFVHIASIVANILSRCSSGAAGVFENESKSSEMLAAGCAVGVACTFSAPVGGVLFSIEVTSVYFAVRDYWRGFFAATWSATVFALLRLISKAKLESDTFDLSFEAHYQTYFPEKDSFRPYELPVFVGIGLVCGFLGALYVFVHRKVVLFIRKNRFSQFLFQKHWLLYPIFISFSISSITFPLGLGSYLGGETKFGETLSDFIADCSWVLPAHYEYSCYNSSNHTIDMKQWTGPDQGSNIFLILVIFQVVFFFLTIIATTLPVPTGIFMSVFILGASLGRTIGELIIFFNPNGLDPSRPDVWIRPGVYGVVGAAAFTGAATHTVSIAVIVFELTGQLVLLLPVMLAVLVANAVASFFQSSIYDSIITIKHLPYLPDIPVRSTSIFHNILVEHFMVSPVKFIARDSTYADLQDIVLSMPKLKAFPLVESKNRQTLLGSISKLQLVRMLETKVGGRARQAEARRRVKNALDDLDERLKNSQDSSAFDDSETIALSLDVPAKKKASRFTVEPVIIPAANDGKETESGKKLPVPSETATQTVLAMGKKRNKRDGEEDTYHTISGMFRSIGKMSFGRTSKPYQRETEFDLYSEEKREWEEQMLHDLIDLSNCHIDPAPFQLVEHTSLTKVHSIFSLLGLNRAYVTECGRLIGVVALKELRQAIQDVHAGQLLPNANDNVTESKETSPLTKDTILSCQSDFESSYANVTESKSDPCILADLNHSDGDNSAIVVENFGYNDDEPNHSVERKRNSKKKRKLHVQIIEPDSTE
ncbi:unnamed protein product [Auanema sp. JU1783]|nr:unnamed protein product [Auanema sp. JU1783]